MALGGVGSIYLHMGIKKFRNEVIEDGDISDGARTFPGAILSPNNYEAEIQDIAIFPRMAKQKDEHLTGEEKSTIRSEQWELMRVSRITRPDACMMPLCLRKLPKRQTKR